MSPESPVSLLDIHLARQRIAPYVRHTPLEFSEALSRKVGTSVFLKLETMQVTGSFKPRISFNKLLTLDAETRARGVIASSAGGHGLGLAYVAQRLGVDAEVYLPASADPQKVERMRSLGARLSFFESVEVARGAARARARETGRTFISAYNDPAIIAGSGTIGLELLEDAPDTDLVLVGMGGGGIASGIGLVLKTVNPRAQLWGVQPENSPVLARWLEAGRPVPVLTRPTIATGLGAHLEEDSLTFPLAARLVDRTVCLTEDALRHAMALLLEEHQLVVEPSGAAPVAALLQSDVRAFSRVVLVLTGRNIDARSYLALMSACPPASTPRAVPAAS
jgi:threonine dehydratase